MRGNLSTTLGSCGVNVLIRSCQRRILVLRPRLQQRVFDTLAVHISEICLVGSSSILSINRNYDPRLAVILLPATDYGALIPSTTCKLMSASRWVLACPNEDFLQPYCMTSRPSALMALINKATMGLDVLFSCMLHVDAAHNNSPN